MPCSFSNIYPLLSFKPSEINVGIIPLKTSEYLSYIQKLAPQLIVTFKGEESHDMNDNERSEE